MPRWMKNPLWWIVIGLALNLALSGYTAHKTYNSVPVAAKRR